MCVCVKVSCCKEGLKEMVNTIFCEAPCCPGLREIIADDAPYLGLVVLCKVRLCGYTTNRGLLAPVLEHSDSRFESILFDSLRESIRFPKKSERQIRFYWLLVSVCQTTDRRITAADTAVMITTHERRARVNHSSVGHPYFAREHAVHGPQPGRLPSLPPPGLRPYVGESNRTNRF